MPDLSGEARVAALFNLLGGPAVLLPIPIGQKKPADPGWQSFGDAEMSRDDYIARFNNGGNIGVVLGKPSNGLCSIDIDEDNLVEEFLKHNPVLRLTLRTRRLFGCNFWIRVTGDYPPLKPFHHSRLLNDKKKPLQIGEWRSTGGQTIIEGQAEGRPYEKIVNAKPVVIPFSNLVWPEWVADPPMLDDNPALPNPGSLNDARLVNLVIHKNGSRHAACPACQENGEDNKGNHLYVKPDGRFGCCKYPADAEHRKLIWKLAGIPKPQNSLRDEYLGECDDHGNPVQVLELPPIISASDFIASDIPPMPMLVEGVLHQGTKMVLGGGSKAYKTWLLSDLAISICAGLPWLGFDCQKGRVLYINLEIQDRFFQERLKVLAAARSVSFTPNSLDLWNLRGFAAPYHFLIPLMIQRIQSESYSLVIIDPIYKLYGKTDENSAGEVAQLLNTLETICTKTQAAVAFGAHYSKGNQAAKESIDRISGSGVFARDPDSILPFTKHEEEFCFTVEPILRNLPPIQPFVLRWKYPLMLRDDSLDPANLKQPSNLGRKKDHNPLHVLAFIAERTSNNPISVSDWSDLSGINRTTLNDYISQLRDAGLVATIGDGSHARKYITEKGLKSLSTPTDGI